MSTSDGRRVNRPYRKASEYLTNKQPMHNAPRTIAALEVENSELREKLTISVRKLETMEVEYEQSREYFAAQLDITQDKLNRTSQALKLMQQNYNELQSINYELEQRVLKVNRLEDDKLQLVSDVHELTNKLTETRSSLQRTQKENERLRKDCNLAVSLLECNAGNFKQQRTEQLPRELQNRVEEYQMDLTQYNEYINPYADDSDSDNENDKRYYHGQSSSTTVPTELLANVLKKPENVHLNLEDTDYIQDPQLNSVYKGQIADKRLVKYDYQESPTHQKPPSHHIKSSTMPRSAPRNEPEFKLMPKSSSGGQSSSPWELATTSTTNTTATSSGSSSPWEMSSNHSTRNEYDADDYSAASAYGAYPVSYRSSKPRSNLPKKYYTPSEKKSASSATSEKKSAYNKTKMSSSYNLATSSNISQKKQKGTGENEDVYISDTYQQQEDGAMESVRPTPPGSGRSSRKSTPAHEKGSGAEKSSLLDQNDSDADDDMVLTVEVGEGAPKVGMGNSPRRFNGVGEERGLLNDSDPEPDEREINYEEQSGDVREFDDEQEEEDVRDAVKHEEVDLLNLDENTQVLSSSENSPAHQIMIQQSLLPSALLPDLPPPSDQQYDGELLLVGEVPAPPPPDMFGGVSSTDQSCLSNAATPHFSNQSILQNLPLNQTGQSLMMSQSSPMMSQYPPMVSQSSTMMSQYPPMVSQSSPMMSQYPPMVSQSSPMMSQYPPMVSQCSPMMSQYPTVMTQSSEISQSVASPKSNSLDDLKSYVQEQFNDASKSPPPTPKKDVFETPSVQVLQKSSGNEEEILSKEHSSACDEHDTTTDNSATKTQEFVPGTNNNLVASTENTESDETLKKYSITTEMEEINENDDMNTEQQENIAEILEGGESQTLETAENHETLKTENDELDELEEDDSQESTGFTETCGTSEPYTARTTDDDCEVIITASSGEPLEVQELQEEPRGGAINNRRRRNSFDQAREFGNVMDD